METVSSSLQKMESGSIHVVRGAIVFPDRRSGRPPAGASRPATLLGGWMDGRTCTWRTRARDRSFRVPWLSSAEQVHPPRPLAASARGRQRAREDARRYGGATCWRAGGGQNARARRQLEDPSSSNVMCRASNARNTCQTMPRFREAHGTLVFYYAIHTESFDPLCLCGRVFNSLSRPHAYGDRSALHALTCDLTW